jgi:hypothetical protein
MTYTAYTAPSVPLFDAIKGFDIDTIASARETFLRTRVGLEVSLNYMYSMSRSFLMPFAVCILYHSNSKLRHFVLIGFLFSLMLTLEKSLSVLALLPIFYLFAAKRNYKMAGMIVLLTFASVSLTSFLARGGVTYNPATIVVPASTLVAAEPQIQAPVEIHVQPKVEAPSITPAAPATKVEPSVVVAAPVAPLETQVVIAAPQSMATIPEQYNMFSGSSQIEYVLNRIFYIPYVTARDWIRYKHEILNDGYTYGKSISLVAMILGEKKINLDKDVFSFQWGQNLTATGSSNTAYFIDAYLNFGIAGSILYTFVIVCILRLTIMSNIATLQACVFVPTIFLLFNSLTAMIFSGGLFLLIIMALFFSERKSPSSVTA